MALAISSVDKRRAFTYVAGDSSAQTEYNVFLTGTPTELEDQEAIAALIAAHVDIPNENDELGTFGIFCSSVSITQHQEQHGYWRVSATYDLEVDDSSSGSFSTTNPLSEPTTYVWGSKSYKETFVEDIHGNAVAMSNGETPSTMPTRDAHYLTCNVSRNVAEDGYDPLLAIVVVGAINSSAFTIAGKSFPAFTVKCISYGGTEVKTTVSTSGSQTDVTFDAETIKFEIKKIAWVTKMHDIGTFEVIGGVPTDLNTPSGKKITKPQSLNGDGRWMDNPDDNITVTTVPINHTGNVGVEALVVDGVTKGAMRVFDSHDVEDFSTAFGGGGL